MEDGGPMGTLISLRGIGWGWPWFSVRLVGFLVASMFSLPEGGILVGLLRACLGRTEPISFKSVGFLGTFFFS